MLENILETKILEISLETKKINTVYVVFAISRDMQKKIVGIVVSQYVTIAINPVTWRSTAVTKVNIKQILSKSIIKSNVCSMLTKNLVTTEIEAGTWIVDVAITWPRTKASSKTLITPSKSKFD